MKRLGNTSSLQEWEKYRPLITSLYVQQNKPLREVMATLETRHGFSATKRMYKSRLTQWGLHKNRKWSENEAVIYLHHQRAAVGKRSRFQLHDRPVDIKNAIRYLRRHNLTIEDVLENPPSATDFPAALRCFTPKPEHPVDDSAGNKAEEDVHSPLPTEPSVEYAVPMPPFERLLQTIQMYILGSFSNGSWCFVPAKQDCQRANNVADISSFMAKSLSSDLFTLVSQSSWLFEQLDFVAAGIYLRKAFSLVQDILHSEDPYAIWELMNSASHLHESGHMPILRSFLKYLAEMSIEVHSALHPLSRIFALCEALPEEEFLQVQVEMRHLAALSFEKATGPHSVTATKMRLGWLRSLGLVRGHESSETFMKNLLGDFESRPGHNVVQSLWILNRLAHSYFERGEYNATEHLSEKMVERAGHLDDAAVKLTFSGRGLALMSRARLAQGRYEEAHSSLKDLVRFNAASFGPGDPLTCASMALLESSYRALGRSYEAELLRLRRRHVIQCLGSALCS